MKKPLILFAVILVAGVSLIVLTRDDGSSSGLTASTTTNTSQDSAPSTTPRAAGPVAANLAPDFNLTRLDGGTISVSEFRGEKAVILDFWASWCPNCRRDMPKLQTLYEQYGNEVEVIAVNLREKESTAQSYVDSEGFTFPVVLDPSGAVSRDYAVQYTNTHVMIGKDGTIQRVIPGDIAESDILSLINS